MLTTALFFGAYLTQTVPEQDATLIHLAKEAVQAEVLGGPLPHPNSQTPVQAVFITIERNGKILGCRGDLTPRTGSLEQEIIQEARGAARHDPRYHPLTSADLQNFLVTVTRVSSVERISSVEGLQPCDGLVLESNGKKGIVLPWEGKDPQVRLRWAYRKAAVSEGSSAILYRLVATRSRG